MSYSTENNLVGYYCPIFTVKKIGPSILTLGQMGDGILYLLIVVLIIWTAYISKCVCKLLQNIKKKTM